MASAERSQLVDIHSHLVPGVDDGARNLEATLEAVARMRRSGIGTIVTTPHIQGSLTVEPNELELRLSTVDAAWTRAAQAIGEHYPDVKFLRGHEVLLDVPNVDLSDPRIRLAGTSFVLVEWPRLHIPPGTIPVLDRLVAAGYQPIVAHPERYSGIGQRLELVQQWRDVGAHMQVNFGSLVGRYGGEAQSVAYRLLEQGWVDYLSSDYHALPTLKVYATEGWDALEEAGATEALRYMCCINPGRMLEDQVPLPVPPLPRERGWVARLRDFLRTSP